MQVARLSPATVRFVALPWRQRGYDGDAVTMLMACEAMTCYLGVSAHDMVRTVPYIMA